MRGPDLPPIPPIPPVVRRAPPDAARYVDAPDVAALDLLLERVDGIARGDVDLEVGMVAALLDAPPLLD